MAVGVAAVKRRDFVRTLAQQNGAVRGVTIVRTLRRAAAATHMWWRGRGGGWYQEIERGPQQHMWTNRDPTHFALSSHQSLM